MHESFINIVKLFFLNTVRILLPFLPLRFIYSLGDLAGRFFIGDKNGVMKKELKELMGSEKEENLDDVIVKTMQNFRKDLFEIWAFPALTRNRANQMAGFEGLHHLRSALAKRKGVILSVAHFGSWKMVLPALGYNGYRVNQVAVVPHYFIQDQEKVNHNVIMGLEHECETSLPVNFFYIEPNKSVRPIYRALQQNEIVVIALDGIIGKKRIPMPFLNKSIHLSAGSPELAYNTGALILPVFIVRQKNGRHRIIIHREVPFEKYDSKQGFVLAYMNYFRSLMAYYVLRHPDHYVRYLYTARKYPVPGVGPIIV